MGTSLRMPSRISSLDGMRAISILFVIAFHLMGEEALWGKSGGLGNLGVRVFFVISGYLITRLLLEELEATGAISLRKFYIRRFLRIFPPFYAFVAAIGICGAAGWIALYRFDLLRAATYTINYFAGVTQSVYVRHIWSLSVEEQFYFLWPAVLCFAGRKRGLRVAALVVLTAPVARLVYWFAVPSVHDQMDRRFETVCDTLATGCVLAGFQHWLAGQTWYNRAIQSLPFLLLPAAIVLTALLSPDRPRINYAVAQTFMNAGIALIIDRFVRFPGSPGGAFLNWGPMRFIGLLSYSLYLWQQPFLDYRGTPIYTQWPWNIVCTIAFSLGSYYLIEKTSARLRGRFRVK